MLSLEGVSKSFGMHGSGLRVVDNVSLHVERGAIHGIIGASGAGKSTLLRLINLLERPDSGTVTVGETELTALSDRRLREERRQIGMIFQQFNLLANRTAAGNVSVPLELAGMPRSQRDQRAEECLRFVGLADKAGEYPSRLSGGQRQRVAIARALASGPQLLLCDEPTSSLDPHTTGGILDLLRHVNESLGVTVVIVTHEMDVVKSVCSHVSVMEKGRMTDSFSRLDGPFRQAAPPFRSYREAIMSQEADTDA